MNNNNPVVISGVSVASVIILVKAILTLVQTMGWVNLSPEKWDALSSFFETVIPIAAIAVATWWTSIHTTSLEKPRDLDGEPLTRSNNMPAIKELGKLQEKALEIDAERTRGLE